MNRLHLLAIAGALLAPAVCPLAAAADGAAAKPVNAMCPIGKEPIVPSAGTVEYDGHVIGLCCPSCGPAFMAWDEPRRDRFVALALRGEEPGQETHGAAKPPAAAPAVEVTAIHPYPLDVCVVSGAKLGSMGDPVKRTYDGREIRFCCASCVATFEADPAKYWAEVDRRIVARQRPTYPLTTCIVTGKPLGADAVDIVHDNRLVRVADADAAKTFAADPDRWATALDRRIVELQLPDYPLEKCPIGGPLGSMGEPVNLVVMNTLVRLCCGGCTGAVADDPMQIVAEVEAARKKKASGAS